MESHKEDTVDWNEQYHAEEWRHGWGVIQNKYLELAGRPERVDMRSYERQGVDVIPTVHMGTAVSALERKGIETNIGNLNRDIKAANRMMNAIRSTIKNLRNWIADILEATKEAFAEVEAEKKNASPDLSNLLRDYMNLRKAERSEWSRYGQQKGASDDLKSVSKAVVYLKEHELFTLEDLDTALQGVNQKAGTISKEMKTASNRMKIITAIQTAVADCQTHKAVHDKYLRIGWKVRQAAFAEKHKDELDCFNKAFRYLKKQGVDLNVDLDALQVEYDKLKATHEQLVLLQKQFMPEDTKVGVIQAFLDDFDGDMVCSKLLHHEALGRFDEPKSWEIREINEIMNQSVTGWIYYPNPRSYKKYGKQRGWMRGNETVETGTSPLDGFMELAEEECSQMELPF